ncbi:MAG: xanthine dehydrogenase family protein molybdopterin-binding subunit [Pseudomonadota bacterium]|nr:xanthine dehydrogenase family protein molybdopterin-binding subunit [Pseudomonadota bacterium]
MSTRRDGMGAPLRRLEDLRLVRGEGCYSADIAVPGMLHGIFVRAEVAHGRIEGIDVSGALAVPGVVAVLTGADAEADGLGTIRTVVPLTSRDGSPQREAPRPVLPTDKVHHVGQPLALVIAETLAAARDGAEAVLVEIEELPAVTDAVAALQDGAALLHETAPGNLAFDWAAGDPEAAAAVVAAAPRRVSVRIAQNRMVGAAVEGRVALAEYDAARDRVVLTTAGQGVHMIHEGLTRDALRWPPERLRVVTPDVGGGFGPKFFVYPEQAAVAWAAWRLKRPLRWVASRGESFLSETHARAQVTEATLGFDDAGRFLGLNVDVVADMGAFLSTFGPGVPTDGMAKSASILYRLPSAAVRVRGAYTSTMAVDAYRGAGKPPMVVALERLIDRAAAELGLSPVELRRRNLVPPEEMPYTTALGKVYDGGDYPAALDRALALADEPGFAARQAASATNGLLRGFGIAGNIHPTGGFTTETSSLSVDGARVVAWTGTQSSGQGHQTVYAQIVAERLGVPVERIEVRQGDTDHLKRGGGTGGSSSTAISGATLTRGADAVIRVGRERAAERLEAAVDDIEYADGTFTVAGTDRRIGLFDLGAERPVAASADFADSVAAFPYGVVVAEVEIDPATGHVRLDRLSSVDDAGRIVNPLLLDGQSQGALAQGAGQALLEQVIYDPESGQLLTGSFMDYGMPRADDLPPIAVAHIETVASTNIIGVRGVGELGANGAPAAIANAVQDALKEHTTDEIPMPYTPDRIWRAIRQSCR